MRRIFEPLDAFAAQLEPTPDFGMPITAPNPDENFRLAESETIEEPQDFVVTGTRWTDAGASSGGTSNSLGSPGGVIAWCVAGAGLTNQTGTGFFTGSTVDLSSFLPFDYQSVLRNAFEAWGQVANIQFIQVTDGGGNIGAGSYPTIRICGGYIDGQSGSNILASAFFPSSANSGGDLVFDSANTSLYASAQNFYLVALHEIGHTLGLNHETGALAIMNPSFNSSLSGLQSDDVAGGRAIYGAQDFGPNLYYMPAGQTSLTLLDNCPTLTIIGNSSSNSIIGSAGGETFRGGAGNDTISGGGGADYAVFSGARSAYTLTPLGGTSVWVTGPDGSDTIADVEWLVFDDQTISWPPPSSIGYWAMNGTSTTWIPLGDPAPNYAVVGVGDFNRDGAADVLLRNSLSDTGYWAVTNNVVAWVPLGRSSGNYEVAGVGDLNNDRSADVLLRDPANGDTGYWAIDGGTAIWRPIGLTSTSYSVVGLGDFNGDRSVDIMIRNPSTGDMGYMQNGSWNFTYVGRSSGAYSVVGPGDFNGDGTSDVLFRNAATGDIGFWAMRDGAATWQYLGRSSGAYEVAGVGDFNSDRIDDIFFRNEATGDAGFWALRNTITTWEYIGRSSGDYDVAGIGDFSHDGTSDVLWRA